MITWAIPDLDLVDLSFRLVDFDAAPIVSVSFGTAIGSIPQSELILTIVGSFIYGDQVVFGVELVFGWEVSVLLALDWHVRIGVSPRQFVGKLVV